MRGDSTRIWHSQLDEALQAAAAQQRGRAGARRERLREARERALRSSQHLLSGALCSS